MCRPAWFAYATAMSLIAATSSAHAGFTLVNRTGQQIDEIHLKGSMDEAWGDDLMGNDRLRSGERIDIPLPRGDDDCHWDLGVAYHDGSSASWKDLDLCDVGAIAIKRDGIGKASHVVRD